MIFPLVSGNKIKEGPVLDNGVMEILCHYHIAVGDWDQDHYNRYLEEKYLDDGSGNCSFPPTHEIFPIHQDHNFLLEVNFFSKTFISDEIRFLKKRVRKIRSGNEQKF